MAVSYKQLSEAKLQDVESNPELASSLGKAYGYDSGKLLSYWKSGYRNFEADKASALQNLNPVARGGLGVATDKYINWNNPQKPTDLAAANEQRSIATKELQQYESQLRDVGLDPWEVPGYQEYTKKLGITREGLAPSGQTSEETAIQEAVAQMKKTGGSYNPLSSVNADLEAKAAKAYNESIKGELPSNNPPRKPGEPIADWVNRGSPTGTPTGEPSPTSSQPSNVVATTDAERARIRERTRSELMPSGTMPNAPKTAEERIRLRQEQGIVNDEQDLADIREEANLAEQEMRQFKAQAGRGVSEFGRIGAVTEAERNASFRLEGLAIRERSLIERLNSKNAFINQVIQDGQTDYANALNRWNTEFSINSKMNDLVNAEMDDIQKDALNTVTTIQNLMKESGKSFDQWPEEMKIQAETAALKAGLPKDTFKLAFSAQSAGEKVLSNIVQDNASGGKDVYVLVQGADGIKLRRVGGTTGTGLETEPPVTKEINGVTYQWDSNTASWEAPNVAGGSPTTVSGEKLAKLPEAKQLAGIAELQRSIGEYKKLIEKFGAASGFTPGDRQKLDAAKESINLAIKNAESLGALQAPDIELVKRMIPDVTRQGIWSSLLGLVVPGEAKRALSTIDQITKSYVDKAGNLYQQLVSQGADPNDPYLKTVSEQAGIKESATQAPAPTWRDTQGNEYEQGADGLYYPKANAPALTSLKIGGKEVTVDKSISGRLVMADEAFFKATGQHLQINQHFRTRAEQAKLYKELSAKGARVAQPGKSFHEKGLAVDITNWKAAEPYLRKYGLKNDLADDKGHFSYGEFS